MCLAIPGVILDTEDRNGSRTARVRFGRIIRGVCLDLVPEARVGDYVIVHVGYAISQLDEKEARESYQILRALGQREEQESDGAEETKGVSSGIP